MHKLKIDATKRHMWGTYGQVEIKSCRVAGQVRRDLKVRDIINSTHSILYPTLCAISWLLFPSPLWQWRALVLASPSTARWKNGGLPLGERSVEGQQVGGPGLLAAPFFPEPYAHCCDEGGPLATTIFGQEEGHITLW